MSHPFFSAARTHTEPVTHNAYQVDYAAVNCGKIVGSSKRRIRFKFGYTDAEALASGKTGQDCRCSEHEVVVTWSLSSGKQAIAFDQYEVYFDVGESTQSKIAHTWKDQRGHVLEVKIHAANMSTKVNPNPDWKQYDLLIDGVSIFRLPKIFEIGVFAREDAANSDTHKFAQPSLAGYSSQGSRSRDAFDNIPPVEPMKPEPEPVVDLLSFDEIEPPAPTFVAATQVAPAQTCVAFAPAQGPAPPTMGQIQQNYPTADPFAAPANPYNNSAPIPTASYQSYQSQATPVTPPGPSTDLVPSEKKPIMNPFDVAPAYQQEQGVFDGYAPQQPLQPQYNGSSQQPVQSGFGYQ